MDGNHQLRNSSVRPLRSPPSSASSAGVGPHHDSLSPSSPSPSLDSSSSESHYNIPGDRAPVLKTGKGSATAKSAGSNSEEVPLLGGERIEAVYKELTYLCPYRYYSTLIHFMHFMAVLYTNYVGGILVLHTSRNLHKTHTKKIMKTFVKLCLYSR